MNTSKEILVEISKLLNRQPKYFIWVPIVTLGIGVGIAFIQNYFTKTEKYVIN